MLIWIKWNTSLFAILSLKWHTSLFAILSFFSHYDLVYLLRFSHLILVISGRQTLAIQSWFWGVDLGWLSQIPISKMVSRLLEICMDRILIISGKHPHPISVKLLGSDCELVFGGFWKGKTLEGCMYILIHIWYLKNNNNMIH